MRTQKTSGIADKRHSQDNNSSNGGYSILMAVNRDHSVNKKNI